MDDTPGPDPGVPRGEPSAARELLIAQLALVDHVTAHVCRRRRLLADEREEFAAHVRLKFVEQDYAILRAFRHRCSLRTYLHIVIERLFLDYRTAQWGRWRPSVQARQMGPAGVLLDRLITRDGYTFDEACSVMQTTYRMDVSRSDLHAMRIQLPTRSKRVLVSETVDVSCGSGDQPDAPLACKEAGQVATSVKAALRAAIGQLTPADRQLLEMRYRQGRSVTDIARALGEPAKPLYRRLQQIVGRLRRPLRLVAGGSGVSADVFRASDVSISW